MRTAKTRRALQQIWIPLGALVAAGGMFVADVATAQTSGLYRWESADGTVSFTDDSRRIPERYREGAATIDRSALEEYGRFTPTDADASADQARRLDQRLDALREFNREIPRGIEARATAPAASPRIARKIRNYHDFKDADGVRHRRYYRERDGGGGDSSSGGYASLPVDPDGPPVVTEQKRVYIPGQPVTRSIVVTRQGDRVLSVVQERRDQLSTLDFGNMSDYEVVPE